MVLISEFTGYARDETFNLSEPDTPVIKNSTDIYQQYAGNFRIYPNPTTQTFTLEFEDPVMGEIEIMDLNGQLIYRKEIHSNKEKIDMTLYTEGIYFVTVRSDTWVMTEKMVKW
jgi:predicted secreted protein